MRPEDKPMLDIDGQIAHLLSKGVKFERITIEEAKTYLDQNNNFLIITANDGTGKCEMICRYVM